MAYGLLSVGKGGSSPKAAPSPLNRMTDTGENTGFLVKSCAQKTRDKNFLDFMQFSENFPKSYAGAPS